MSRIITTIAAAAALSALSGAASANCGTMYCSSGAHSPSSYNTTSYNQGFSTTMSPIEADATYGTGSISPTYTDTSSVQYFSGSTSSVSGLGYNESLQPTSCPVNVSGTSAGSTVLGCYNVVQPVARTSYYRVVRPVIYVRYPVPVAVPYVSPCLTRVVGSRYGDLNHKHGAHHYGARGGFGHRHGARGGFGHRHGAHHSGGCR